MNNIKSYQALFSRAFLFLTIIVLSVSGCSTTKKNIIDYKEHSLSPDDYMDHLEHLALNYLNSPNVKVRKLTGVTNRYLQSVYKRIVFNNELILTKNITPVFYIIRSNQPFYFSTPKGRFFMSDTLVRKFTKSENVFVSFLANEIYRVHKNLYEKNTLVPLGYMSTKKMLSLHKLPLAVKVESLKWSYFLLNRSGYDGYSVLSWIQVQNKNRIEFSAQLGSSQSQSKEEFLFKNFMANEVEKKQDNLEFLEKNSSKGFYKLQRTLL